MIENFFFAAPESLIFSRYTRKPIVVMTRIVIYE
jgi:hypothetical protein